MAVISTPSPWSTESVPTTNHLSSMPSSAAEPPKTGTPGKTSATPRSTDSSQPGVADMTSTSGRTPPTAASTLAFARSAACSPACSPRGRAASPGASADTTAAARPDE